MTIAIGASHTSPIHRSRPGVHFFPHRVIFSSWGPGATHSPTVQSRRLGKNCLFPGWHGRCLGDPQMNTVEMDLDQPSALESETVIHLPSGLLGFEKCKKYLLLSNANEEPFHWFQVVDDPAITFLVVSPFQVLPNYRPDLPADDVRFLQLERPEDALLLSIVSLRPDGRSTVNLKGPIVVNRFTLIGKQSILSNAAEYSVQHPLPEEER